MAITPNSNPADSKSEKDQKPKAVVNIINKRIEIVEPLISRQVLKFENTDVLIRAKDHPIPDDVVIEIVNGNLIIDGDIKGKEVKIYVTRIPQINISHEDSYVIADYAFRSKTSNKLRLGGLKHHFGTIEFHENEICLNGKKFEVPVNDFIPSKKGRVIITGDIDPSTEVIADDDVMVKGLHMVVQQRHPLCNFREDDEIESYERAYNESEGYEREYNKRMSNEKEKPGISIKKAFELQESMLLCFERYDEDHCPIMPTKRSYDNLFLFQKTLRLTGANYIMHEWRIKDQENLEKNEGKKKEEAGAPDDFSFFDDQDCEMLIHAIVNLGSVEYLKCAIAAGANVDEIYNNFPPLYYALLNAHFDCAEELIKSGAKTLRFDTYEEEEKFRKEADRAFQLKAYGKILDDENDDEEATNESFSSALTSHALDSKETNDQAPKGQVKNCIEISRRDARILKMRMLEYGKEAKDALDQFLRKHDIYFDVSEAEILRDYPHHKFRYTPKMHFEEVFKIDFTVPKEKLTVFHQFAAEVAGVLPDCLISESGIETPTPPPKVEKSPISNNEKPISFEIFSEEDEKEAAEIYYYCDRDKESDFDEENANENENENDSDNENESLNPNESNHPAEEANDDLPPEVSQPFFAFNTYRANTPPLTASSSDAPPLNASNASAPLNANNGDATPLNMSNGNAPPKLMSEF